VAPNIEFKIHRELSGKLNAGLADFFAFKMPADMIVTKKRRFEGKKQEAGEAFSLTELLYCF